MGWGWRGNQIKGLAWQELNDPSLKTRESSVNRSRPSSPMWERGGTISVVSAFPFSCACWFVKKCCKSPFSVPEIWCGCVEGSCLLEKQQLLLVKGKEEDEPSPIHMKFSSGRCYWHNAWLMHHRSRAFSRCSAWTWHTIVLISTIP